MNVDVRIENWRQARRSVVYQKRVISVLKRQIKMNPTEEKLNLQASQKENMLHPVDTSFFSTLAIRLCPR